jgi:hypothetical protein
VPLAHLYYPGPALRPMSDFDVVVPYARTDDAIALLQAAGWRGDNNPGLRNPTPHRSSVGHAWGFRNSAGAHVDLHWKIIKTSVSPAANEGLWRDAEPFTFAGAATLTLNPADHLLHTCAHGLPLNRVPSMRWVADALMILRTRAPDWDRLVSQAQAQRLSVILIHTLTYLRDFFQAPVPDAVLQRLRAGPIERWELGEYAYLTRPQTRMARRLYDLSHGFSRFRRTMPAAADASALRAYVHYVQVRWDLQRAGEIPLEAWRRWRQPVAALLSRRRASAAR